MSLSPEKGEIHDSDKLRVLVVDDEPTLRLGFAYALANKSTTVETATNGRSALERLAAEPFDIVVLDLRMPELDGIAVIKTLRHRGSKVPVVLCSAALTPNAALHAIRQGVVDFLLKPVRPVDLRDVIEFVMRPDKSALSQALRSARNGLMDEAIRILEGDQNPCNKSIYWLGILKSIRGAATGGDVSWLEEQVGAGLSTLAFNASNNL